MERLIIVSRQVNTCNLSGSVGNSYQYCKTSDMNSCKWCNETTVSPASFARELMSTIQIINFVRIDHPHMMKVRGSGLDPQVHRIYT